MKHLLGPLLGLTLLTSGPASGALVYYELTLTTDAPYTGFGGGEAGDVFTGVFGFNAAFLGSSDPVFEPILSQEGQFFHFDIGGSVFSSEVAGTRSNNGFQFNSGALADVFFDIINPVGDRLTVSTITGFETTWIATQSESGSGGGGGTAGGSTRSVSVRFKAIPEPATLSLAAVGLLVLLRRHR